MVIDQNVLSVTCFSALTFNCDSVRIVDYNHILSQWLSVQTSCAAACVQYFTDMAVADKGARCMLVVRFCSTCIHGDSSANNVVTYSFAARPIVPVVVNPN
jgi:hypothetical protein